MILTHLFSTVLTILPPLAVESYYLSRPAPSAGPKIFAKRELGAVLEYRVARVGAASIDLEPLHLGDRDPLPKFSYPFSADLRSGGVSKEASDKFAHRICDLQIGDSVSVVKDNINDGKDVYIIGICIVRRAGDQLIPASQYPDTLKPYHVWQNAINGWNNKGIAIPDQILKQYGETKHPPPPPWMVKGQSAPFK